MGRAFPEPWPVGSDGTCPTPQPGAVTTCRMCHPQGARQRSARRVFIRAVSHGHPLPGVHQNSRPPKMGCSAQAIVFVQFMPSEALLAHGCKPFPNPHSQTPPEGPPCDQAKDSCSRPAVLALTGTGLWSPSFWSAGAGESLGSGRSPLKGGFSPGTAVRLLSLTTLNEGPCAGQTCHRRHLLGSTDGQEHDGQGTSTGHLTCGCQVGVFVGNNRREFWLN